jgi:hypothetical protein
VYSTLMPTLYERYHVTNCRNGFHWSQDECTPPSGAGVLGSSDPTTFTTLGPPHQADALRGGVPCLIGTDGYDICTWTKPPDALINKIWGPLSDLCKYVPGKSATAWTFGNCNAGADLITTVGKNTWNFPSYAGNPDPYNAPGGYTSSAAAAQPAAARSRSPIRLGRPRLGRRSAARARTRLSGEVSLPRGMRLAGAKVTVHRLLLEEHGHGELTRPHRGRAARPLQLKLRRVGAGRFTAAKTGRRSTRIALHRAVRRGRTQLTLSFAAPTFRTPRACHALPASIATDTEPLQLKSRLVIRAGRTRHRILLEHHVRCRRDARGNVHRLEYVNPRRHPLRRGLAVSLHAPPRARPGTTVRFTARVHNRRRGSRRLRSSVWDVTLHAHTLNRHGRTIRIRELRRGRSRRLTVTRSVPRGAHGRFCAVVVATAPGTHAVHARACAPVRAARAPTATG